MPPTPPREPRKSNPKRKTATHAHPPGDSGRARLVSTVNNALGFYVLTLLIGEAYLGVVLYSPAVQAAGITTPLAFAGTGVFIGVVALVAWLSIKNREALFLGREEVAAQKLQELELHFSAKVQELEESFARYKRFDSKMAEIRELMKMGRYEAARQRSEALAAKEPSAVKIPNKAEALVQQGNALYEEAKQPPHVGTEREKEFYREALKQFIKADKLANGDDGGKAIYLRPIYNCACMSSLLREFDSAIGYLVRAIKLDAEFTQALCSDEADLLPLFDANPDRLATTLQLTTEGLRSSLNRVRPPAGG